MQPRDGDEIAQWLVEVGRRSGHAVAPKEHPPAGSPQSGNRRRLVRGGIFTRTLLLFILAVSYLQYHYFEVMIEISSLPTIVVFLPPKTPTT